MVEYGGGWLGWTEEQTLNCDLNFLITAHRGRATMLNAVIKALLEGAFGPAKPTVTVPDKSKPPVDAKGKPIVLSPAVFDAQFLNSKRRFH